MKSLYYVGTVCLALMVVSCIKESKIENAQVQLVTSKSKLKYIQEVLITDSMSRVSIPIDSNTAIVHANGDTTFPRWYRKELAALANAGARAVGDLNDQGLFLQENDNFTAPKKLADGNSASISYVVPHAYQSVSFIQYRNGEIVSYMGTYNGPATGEFSYNMSFGTLTYSTQYIDMEADTYDANGNPVAYMNRRHFYTYGWQTLAGLGTAYGADLKVTNIDSDPRPDFVGMISNRTSGSVNGISYKVFRNVNRNGVANDETSVVTKLLYPTTSSPYSPAGGSVAVADINNNGKKDFVFLTFTSIGTADQYNLRYIIAYDINENGQPASWSNVFVIPAINQDSNAGSTYVGDIGITITDVNGDGEKDIVLAEIWNGGGQALAVIYKVGTSITASGSATWTTGQNTMSFATFPETNVPSVKGGGIAIGRITDKPGGGPLVMIANYYANSGTPYFANMPVIIESNNYPWYTAPQNEFRTVNFPTVGVDCRGGGIDIADIDGNGTNDLLNMAYVGNVFRFYINYDMVMHYYNTTTYDNFGIPYFKRGMTTSHTN